MLKAKFVAAINMIVNVNFKFVVLLIFPLFCQYIDRIGNLISLYKIINEHL